MSQSNEIMPIRRSFFDLISSYFLNKKGADPKIIFKMIFETALSSYYIVCTDTLTLNKSPSTSIFMDPPCKSTIDCDMANPNPDPSV